MAPRKRNARSNNAAQPMPTAAQSDYDTDTANLADVASAISHPPPSRTNTELNLTVLQRYLPGIEHIIAIAPFAVVYIFSAESQSWEKYGMEGTLFVCQQNGPRWKVIVLNRKSLENFVAELHSPDDVELTTDYVILQVANAEGDTQIFGLWIFSDANEAVSTKETVAQAIHACAMQASAIAGQAEEAYDENEFYEAEETPVHYDSQPPVEQPTGQTLDLSQIFGKPAFVGNAYSAEQHMGYHDPRFLAHADTNFFRNTASPGTQQGYAVPSASPHPQQDVLLGLFKR